MRFGVVGVLAFSCIAFGQEPPAAAPRAKIGLALEGGGALGFAHIGVLDWMEEHHIPVDYVAGTSMGGLVGGAYATGMRPQEIRALVSGIDWNTVLRGTNRYTDLSFRRKEDRRDYPNSLEFGLRKGASFPSGFNAGQEVGFILDRIALPYSTIKSFDDLPIPFRCIATDLVARRQHAFTGGSLSQALRATMSIPGFFTPVRDQGRIFVDGGLLDNLPTDVAKEMGGDVIIGVHLEEAELGGDVSLSAFGTLSESFSVITAVNERRGMETADLLVTVDVAKFTFADFNQPGPLIAQGYKAAEKNASALLKFALNDSDWEAHLARREARRVKNVPAPTFIAVTGTTPAQADLIKKDVHLPEGNTIDVGDLEDKLRLVTGGGRFASVGFSMTEKDQRPGLDLNAVEKGYAPPTVNPIFIVDGSQYDNVLFSAGARFTFLDVGRTGAELRADLLAGSTYQFAAEYWRPIGSRRWFIAPRTLVSSVPVNLYSYSTQIAGYRATRANGGFDLGYSFDRFSQFRAGYELGWESYTPFVGNPQLLPTVSGQQSLTRMRYVLDKLDSPTVPREGTAALIGFDFYDHRPGAEDKIPLLRADMQFFKPIHRNDSVYFSASGGTTFGFSKTGVPLFSLGGPLRLSAYGANEILTNQYFLFHLGYLRQIGKLPRILGNNVYFNSVYEVAKPYKTQFAQLNGYSRVPMDAAAGIVVETIFGPAFIGGSWGDAGHRKIFFRLGRVF